MAAPDVDSTVGPKAASLITLQPLILAFGLLEDGDVGVGIFPEGEEVPIGSLGLGGVALQRRPAPLILASRQRDEQEPVLRSCIRGTLSGRQSNRSCILHRANRTEPSAVDSIRTLHPHYSYASPRHCLAKRSLRKESSRLREQNDSYGNLIRHVRCVVVVVFQKLATTTKRPC